MRHALVMKLGTVRLAGTRVSSVPEQRRKHGDHVCGSASIHRQEAGFAGACGRRSVPARSNPRNQGDSRLAFRLDHSQNRNPWQSQPLLVHPRPDALPAFPTLPVLAWNCPRSARLIDDLISASYDHVQEVYKTPFCNDLGVVHEPARVNRRSALQAVRATSTLEPHAETGATSPGWGCAVGGAVHRACRLKPAFQAVSP